MMLRHSSSFAFLLVLFPGLGVAAWCQESVQVESVTLPELVWNTNTVQIALRNPTKQLLTVIINVQAKNHRGFGWETKHTLAARESVTIAREFTMPPFPGKARVVIAIREKDGAEIYKREFNTEFGFENKRIGKLHPPQWLMEMNPYKRSPLAAEYPPFDMARRGHFVFYYPENFAYVRTHLTELADARERVYSYLQKVVNPAFHEDVAVFLFPICRQSLRIQAIRGRAGPLTMCWWKSLIHGIPTIRNASIRIMNWCTS